MALAALELGKRTPRSTISDPGYFTFGDRRFRDSKPGGHGAVDLHKSIVVSCDTYYYVLANDMGIDAIAAFMTQLGFGAQTGIDLNGEAAGVLPSPEWKQARFKRPEQQKWYPGETISIGIGQGYNAYTPLQLAQAMATVAANGAMYRPHLVRHVENPRTRRAQQRRARAGAAGAAEARVGRLRQARDGRRQQGRHRRARLRRAPYTSGGKTGTAQVIAMKQNEKYDEKKIDERHRDHSLFIAFAPLDNPTIALAVHRRERRLRRARRGADRAHRARLLPARQAAGGAAGRRARRRRRPGERLMELAQLSLAAHRQRAWSRASTARC